MNTDRNWNHTRSIDIADVWAAVPVCLHESQHQGPDRVDEEQEDADGVGRALALLEGLPDST